MAAPPQQHAPAIAVIGLPDLPAALRSCGYDCLGAADGDTSPSAVAAATRKAALDGRPYVVIVAGNDPSLRSWVAVQVAQGRPVLIATSEHLPFGDPVAKTRTISLPATVDEIMAVFGAPPAGGAAGGVTILSDGRAFAEPVPDPEPAHTPVGDDDPFATSLFDNPLSVEPTIDVSSTHTPAPSNNPFVTQEIEVVRPEIFKESSSSADALSGTLTPTSNSGSTSNSEQVPAPAPVHLPMRLPSQSSPVSPFRLQAEVVPAPAPFPIRRSDPPTDPFSDPFSDPPDDPSGALSSADSPHFPGQSTFHPDQEPASSVIPPNDPPNDPPAFVEDAFRAVPSPLATPTRNHAGVIIPFAGKGGVGKSTVAFAIAERAVIVGDIKRVVLIDANRGQGDARTYARIQGQLPSIYDAAISGKPEAAIVGPQRLCAARPGLPDLHIGIVLAPTFDQADRTIVTEEVYGAVIDYARSIADLVVIDTQIVEASDTSGLIDNVMIPLLRAGAWGVGLSDSSMPGVKNLIARFTLFQRHGVSPDRMMIALNRVAADSGIKPDAIAAMMAQYGTWMGTVVQSTALATAFEVGQIPGTSATPSTRSAPPAPDAEFAAMLDRVLYRVTGLDAFAPRTQAEPPARKRFGLRRPR